VPNGQIQLDKEIDFGAKAIASVGYCDVGVPSQHSNKVFASPGRAGATLFLIEDIAHPLEGLMQISRAPAQIALSHLGQ
jgi:hypothetical protein